MKEVARQERRRVPVALTLALCIVVLAIPGLVVLMAQPTLGAGVALSVAGLHELVAATADNPFFWVAAAATVLWLGWLASRHMGERP